MIAPALFFGLLSVVTVAQPSAGATAPLTPQRQTGGGACAAEYTYLAHKAEWAICFPGDDCRDPGYLWVPLSDAIAFAGVFSVVADQLDAAGLTIPKLEAVEQALMVALRLADNPEGNHLTGAELCEAFPNLR